MQYFFNITNLFAVIVLGLVFALSLNEVAKLAGKMQTAQRFAQAQLLGTRNTFTSQEECQSKTGYICYYEECNYVPVRKTLAEVCGADLKKGWKATTTAIPENFRRVVAVRLTVTTKESVGTLEMRPRELTIAYQSTPTGSSNQVKRSHLIRASDVTRITNKMIEYELDANDANGKNLDVSNGTIFELYTASAKKPESILQISESALADEVAYEQTLQCSEAQCSQDFLEIVRDIARLWGSPVTELPFTSS